MADPRKIDLTEFATLHLRQRPGTDVALVNGIFNLNPAREAVFRELARVVRSGGSVYAAELILREPLPPHIQENLSDWFA